LTGDLRANPKIRVPTLGTAGGQRAERAHMPLMARDSADDSASSQNVGAPWRVYCDPFAIRYLTECR